MVRLVWTLLSFTITSNSGHGPAPRLPVRKYITAGRSLLPTIRLDLAAVEKKYRGVSADSRPQYGAGTRLGTTTESKLDTFCYFIVHDIVY